MKMPKTTAGLLKYYAEHSALGSTFAVDALSKAADKTLANKKLVREQLKDSMVNPEAWIRAAEEWKDMWRKFVADKT